MAKVGLDVPYFEPLGGRFHSKESSLKVLRLNDPSKLKKFPVWSYSFLGSTTPNNPWET